MAPPEGFFGEEEAAFPARVDLLGGVFAFVVELLLLLPPIPALVLFEVGTGVSASHSSAVLEGEVVFFTFAAECFDFGGEAGSATARRA